MEASNWIGYIEKSWKWQLISTGSNDIWHQSAITLLLSWTMHTISFESHLDRISPVFFLSNNLIYKNMPKCPILSPFWFFIYINDLNCVRNDILNRKMCQFKEKLAVFKTNKYIEETIVRWNFPQLFSTSTINIFWF